MQLTIRDARDSDLNLVMDAWLRSYRGNSRRMKSLGKAYWHMQRAMLQNVLRRVKTVCLVPADDDDYVLGFVVGEERNGAYLLHYVWTRKRLEDGSGIRHKGLAKTLVDSQAGKLPIIATCMTDNPPKWIGALDLNEDMING